MTSAIVFLVGLMTCGSIVAMVGFALWRDDREDKREHERWMVKHRPDTEGENEDE